MKTVIVTGGTKGIGKCIVTSLLSEGYEVYTCSRNAEDLKMLEQELNHHNLHIFVLDLAERQDIIEFCNDWEKPLYGLVNNAGICLTEHLSENNPAVWDMVSAVNLNGPYFLTKGLLPKFQDNGRIVNIASQLGREGRAGYSAYCASKFALLGLTKTWAYELGSRGITVNAVCPGWVRTEMTEKDLTRIAAELNLSKEQYHEKICAQLELKRFTQPSEVANLVSFLLSEKASGITGRDWLLNVIWNQDQMLCSRLKAESKAR